VSLKRVPEDSPLRVGPTSFILSSLLHTTFQYPFYRESNVLHNVPPYYEMEQAGEKRERIEESIYYTKAKGEVASYLKMCC
jgi:hypothetical protein